MCAYCHKKATCKFGDKCYLSHDPISVEAKKNFKFPSRTSSPASDNRKGRGGGAASTASQPRLCSRFFLKGKCEHGADCMFAHLSKEVVGQINKAKAKAKAKGKANAKAKVVPTIPHLCCGAPHVRHG